jgi:hypothetical protein
MIANLPQIYTVTTLHLKEQEFGASRTVAWYPDLEDAIKCVIENWGDIFETSYTYALIETLSPGLYPRVVQERWFEWREDGYKRCERPEPLHGVVSFSIG